MRKVLVFGAAFAAAALSAVAIPADARSEPDPWTTGTAPGGATTSLTPTVPPPSSSATPAPTAPAGPPTAPPTAPRRTGPATARAVMVTPPHPQQQTFSYGPAARQRVDVYWPADDDTPGKTRPGVLLLHGGSWLGGDKSNWRYTARKLVAHGYTVYAANYRLTGTAPWPAQRQDAMSALRWVRRTAARWRTDPSRLVVIGSSAGGHLATQLGTYRTGSNRLRGVVALSPVNSPYLAYQDGGKPNATQQQSNLRDAVTQLVGCTPSEQDAACWSKLEDASSIAHVNGDDVPMLLLHTAKEFVPATHSTALNNALRSVGVRSTLRVYPGNEHGGAMLRDEKIYASVVRWIDELT